MSKWTDNRKQVVTAILMIATSFFIGGLPVFSSTHGNVVSGSDSFDLDEVQNLIEQRQWTDAEQVLLERLWNQTSGMETIPVAETMARVCILLHKGSQAMEWLERIDGKSFFAHRNTVRNTNFLKILQRIYLPDRGYSLNRNFQIKGIDLDGPVDLEISDDGNLVIMDRYRLITLQERESDKYYPVPPTLPLPDDTISLKLVNNLPIVITRYGYWHDHRINYFGKPDQLTRIIDSAVTRDDFWLVLDRRNAQMLKFNMEGQQDSQLTIPKLSGDEKVIKNIYGGSWILHPSSRQIISAGSAFDVKIPFRGPGYILNDPVDMTTDHFGHLFVLDEDNVVTIFSPSGVRLRRIELDTSGELIRAASSISIRNDGRMYITDRKNHAVFCFH